MVKKRRIEKEDGSNYNGAVVLGLNDALVEISGALVGLSFAFAESRLIGTVGLITGFAAALSMAASEYLSAEEDNRQNPMRAAAYTGVAYLLAVFLLVAPYFFISNVYVAAAVMFAMVIVIIAIYTGYTTSMKKSSFKSKFGKMLTITITVSIISFLFGMLVKNLVG